MTRRSTVRSDVEIAALLRAWLRGGLAELPYGGELPAAVREEVLRQLDDTPQHRRRWLGRWLNGLPGVTRDAGDRGSDTTRRDRLMFATTAAVGVAILALAASLVVPSDGGPNPAPAAPASPESSTEPVVRSDGSTKVTGSVVSVGGDESAGESTEEGVVGQDWVGRVRGQRPVVEFEWSDPRLPDRATMVGNYDAYGYVADGDVGVVVLTNLWSLEGPDGSWTGPWTGWCDEQWLCHGTVTLTGHGAYEGLYAVLTERPQEDAAGAVTKVLEGAILAGEMPPIPESMGPTTE